MDIIQLHMHRSLRKNKMVIIEFWEYPFKTKRSGMTICQCLLPKFITFIFILFFMTFFVYSFLVHIILLNIIERIVFFLTDSDSFNNLIGISSALQIYIRC